MSILYYPVSKIIGLWRMYDLIKYPDFIKEAILPYIEADLSEFFSRMPTAQDPTRIYMFKASLDQEFHSLMASRELTCISGFEVDTPTRENPTDTPHLMKIRWHVQFPRQTVHEISVLIKPLNAASRDLLYMHGRERMVKATEYLETIPKNRLEFT